MVRISQEQIKQALLEIMDEKPDYFKEILKELIIERKKNVETVSEQDARFEKILDEDFAEYKNVFNRLA